MFAESRDLQRLTDAVVKAAAKLGRGDTLKYTEVERVTGEERNTNRWKSVITKARRAILRDRGIALRAIDNVGYRLCELHEQMDYCSRNRQRRATRQINRGVGEVEAVPPGELSTHRQQVRATMIQQMVSQRRHVKRDVRYQSQALRGSDTPPRRPPPGGKE